MRNSHAIRNEVHRLIIARAVALHHGRQSIALELTQHIAALLSCLPDNAPLYPLVVEYNGQKRYMTRIVYDRQGRPSVKYGNDPNAVVKFIQATMAARSGREQIGYTTVERLRHEQEVEALLKITGDGFGHPETMLTEVLRYMIDGETTASIERAAKVA